MAIKEQDPRVDPRIETSLEINILKNMRDSQKEVCSYWDNRFENVYLTVLEDISEMGRHGVIAELINRVVLNGNILDVGCGTGILSELVDLKRFQYIGIDISEVALRLAKKKRARTNVDFINASIEEFETQIKFETIVFNEVLYYLDYENIIKTTVDMLVGQKLFIASAFDFAEGQELRQWLRNHTTLISEIIIENPKDNLKWYIIAFRL